MNEKSTCKAFVSSTFEDLKEHRKHVIDCLRRAGVFVDPMEEWTADSKQPTVFCLERINGCDLCVLLVAFRRGYVPDDEALSITQMEYQHAVAHGIDVLVFLLDEDAPWRRTFDERDTDKDVDRDGISAWRASLMKTHGVGFFGLEPASVDVHPAVARWLQSRPKPPAEGEPPVREERPTTNSIAYYLKCLTEETKTLTMLGMGRSLQVELPIGEAYVPLQTTLARSFEAKETGRFEEGRADHEEVVDLMEVFQKAKLLGHRGVVLLGEPGSGKTTGARQLIWRLASGQKRPEELGLPTRVLPVFLRFRNLSGEALNQRYGLRMFLEEESRNDAAPTGCEMPGPDLWDRGRLLWVLDGLDEVIDARARKKVSGWIEHALQNRPEDWFVVTCRFQGYYRKGVPLGSKFVEFHVRPLEQPQVERFVRDWFAAAHRKLQGPGQRAVQRATADSSQLLEILTRPAYQTGHMRELCTNLLLLTILCIVFHEERKLPTGRAELYAHCVRVLLEYWRRDLYESQTGLKPYDAEAAQSVLAGVAWWMHAEQDRTAAPLDELAEVAEKGLAEVSPSSGLGGDGRAFLERMRDEAGILAMVGRAIADICISVFRNTWRPNTQRGRAGQRNWLRMQRTAGGER